MQSKCFLSKHTNSETSLGHVLVIESDDKTAHLIKLELLYEGYRVDLQQNGTLGLLTIREAYPDLVILSSSLPDILYTEICQRLRTTCNSIPIIAIAEDQQECLAALNAGADDCLMRPFALEELLARIRAKLRQLQTALPSLSRYGDLVLDQAARQIYLNEQEIELTATEFNLLEYLMAHSKQVMSQDQILKYVWGSEQIGKSNIVEVYVGYLRRKLEAHYPKRLIHTVRSVGYVLR